MKGKKENLKKRDLEIAREKPDKENFLTNPDLD